MSTAARPEDFGQPLTRREVEQELVELGFWAGDAPRMAAEYVDETSALVGVRVDNWSLDFADVDAIADSYEWVDLLQDESLDQARERAAGRAVEENRWAAELGDDAPPGFLESNREVAQLWAERARTPGQEPAEHEDRASGRATTAAVENADASIACAAAAAAAAEAAARARGPVEVGAAPAAAGDDTAAGHGAGDAAGDLADGDMAVDEDGGLFR